MSEHATERQVPLILIAVGLCLYAIAAFLHAGAVGVGMLWVAVIIGGVIQTALLIGAAFLVATFLSVSFGDFRSAVLKFAGAALAAGGLGAVIPFGGLVAAFVFLGLILWLFEIWLFEIEIPYAIALAVVYWVLSALVIVGLRSALA